MERWKKLAYDVGVNVVANLIAGAIIYLGGVWVGLFPADPLALVLTTTILAATITIAVVGIVVLISPGGQLPGTAIWALMVAATVFLIGSGVLVGEQALVVGGVVVLPTYVGARAVSGVLLRSSVREPPDDQPPLPGL